MKALKKNATKVSKKLIGEILVVEVENKFDRAMLFCKAQEFYESPNYDFRGKYFSIWDYLKWHEAEYGESYTMRWEGFNVPMEVAKMGTVMIQTFYDIWFAEIIKEYGSSAKYIIGVDAIGSPIYEHEMAHGLYYTNSEYKLEMELAIGELSNEESEWCNNFLSMEGYADDKINDEIQAYMVSGFEEINGLDKKFKEIYGRYTNIG
jgi:hypothetical protein